ncbi:hypothetical protein FACS1894184_17360 [Clostridia bacterium]|nr:hypothetical protein FACS1894184_17360 [Clostridia bacterium]
MDERLEERFLKPAISPDAAVGIPHDSGLAADKAEQIGMTPAMARVDAPAGELPSDPTKRLSGVLRNHLRQSSEASDKLRGVNIKWQTNDIPKDPPARTVPTGGNPGAQTTSARVPTYIRGRSGESSSRSLRAPMDRVLAGTVRRMVQHDASYKRTIMPIAHEIRGAGERSPIAEKLPPIDPNANATARITGYLQQLARDSYEPPKIDLETID